MTPTSLFIAYPWLGALLWLVLHTADHGLTIAAARRYRDGVREVMELGAYELNPLFRASVEELRLLSARFVLTLVLGAAAFWGGLAFLAVEPAATAAFPFDVVGLLLGMLVLTRALIIGRHLHNIWLFALIQRGDGLIQGRLRQAPALTLWSSAAVFLQSATLLGIAAWLAPSAWTAGGALGCALLALQQVLLGRRCGSKLE